MDHDSPNFLGSSLYLLTNFLLGMVYFGFLAGAYLTVGALTMILIGLPMLSLLFALTRSLAMFDYRLSALFLGLRAPENQHPELERSALYMFSKFPMGIVSLMLLSVGFPLVLLEAMLLAPFGVTRGRVLAQLFGALARMIYDFKGSLLGIKPDLAARERDLLQRERAALERERAALERERLHAARGRLDGLDDADYDSDGEIVPIKRKREG